jgi:hypothetical protein
MRFEKFGRARYVLVPGLAALAVVLFALLTGGRAGGAPADTVLATFNVPGTYAWTVPTGVRKVIFDVYGASGGNIMGGDFLLAAGGAGGEARGTFTVKPGQTFMIVVGGRGGNGGTTGGAGGFNGGGRGGNGDPGGSGRGGGGGGSDVRVGGIGNPCLSDLSCGFGGRIIVGGGGGGGGKNLEGDWADGGAGGGLVGGPDVTRGGTQEHGGGSGSGGGAFGLGGDGGIGGSAGAGGGGWYGGAAAGGGGVGFGTGSGGGSGFISRFARKGSFPGGVRAGDGLVVISTP